MPSTVQLHLSFEIWPMRPNCLGREYDVAPPSRVVLQGRLALGLWDYKSCGRGAPAYEGGTEVWRTEFMIENVYGWFSHARVASSNLNIVSFPHPP